MRERLIQIGVRHPKAILIIMVLTTLVCGAMIPLIRVDTDPENMLSEDEAVRVFHNLTKERFNLHDIVVVGVVNNEDPDGVFNPDSLKRIYELTQYAAGLQWPDKDDSTKQVGVIEHDIIAPSTVENIEQGGPNQITLRWLMSEPPATRAEAQSIRARAMNSPLLADTLVSEDGKALCIYLPLTSKDLSHDVYVALKDKIATFTGPEKYYITGLPVAEDTFGVEMFIQMAISAPLAMAVIFILMLMFFRKLVLVISPMIIAMVAVITTMGLLIGTGHPVHIMSSMIPIFLMPIAVVDSVHILSEFFDRYTPQLGREKAISNVMNHLFMPMLYTSLTSAAGFLSLALTPIPPVQVFGVYVALGILIAWIWTVLFVPAYVMLLSEKRLANFGAGGHHEAHTGLLPRILARLGQATYNYAKPILIVFALIAAVAVYGVTRIQVNDNPVKWFAKSHPIRQADIELNKHFGGTYMAYLVIDAQTTDTLDKSFETSLDQDLSQLRDKLQKEKLTGLDAAFTQAKALLTQALDAQRTQDKPSKAKVLKQWDDSIKKDLDKASDDTFDAWYELDGFAQLELQKLEQPLKDPDLLRYLSGLQAYVKKLGVVGKSNAVTDVVKTVHREIYDGKQDQATIPDKFTTVGEFLTQAQSGHRPDDLWHLVTP
ncbi:MAG: MMPL family transporter, partial [Sedimentisphaerales bacterium]|nr:MMPL family transporter [Sedimentisphaerales bacterium]